MPNVHIKRLNKLIITCSSFVDQLILSKDVQLK